MEEWERRAEEIIEQEKRRQKKGVWDMWWQWVFPKFSEQEVFGLFFLLVISAGQYWEVTWEIVRDLRGVIVLGLVVAVVVENMLLKQVADRTLMAAAFYVASGVLGVKAVWPVVSGGGWPNAWLGWLEWGIYWLVLLRAAAGLLYVRFSSRNSEARQVYARQMLDRQVGYGGQIALAVLTGGMYGWFTGRMPWANAVVMAFFWSQLIVDVGGAFWRNLGPKFDVV